VIPTNSNLDPHLTALAHKRAQRERMIKRALDTLLNILLVIFSAVALVSMVLIFGK
jgi:lipopolysaccharide/colanic/teichoic acid biosynthesis glycosyltransferase